MITAAYFFDDEAGRLNGPYKTAADAELAADAYGRRLNDGSAYDGAGKLTDMHRDLQDFRDEIAAACNWRFIEPETK